MAKGCGGAASCCCAAGVACKNAALDRLLLRKHSHQRFWPGASPLATGTAGGAGRPAGLHGDGRRSCAEAGAEAVDRGDVRYAAPRRRAPWGSGCCGHVGAPGHASGTCRGGGCGMGLACKHPLLTSLCPPPPCRLLVWRVHCGRVAPRGHGGAWALRVDRVLAGAAAGWPCLVAAPSLPPHCASVPLLFAPLRQPPAAACTPRPASLLLAAAPPSPQAMLYPGYPPVDKPLVIHYGRDFRIGPTYYWQKVGGFDGRWLCGRRPAAVAVPAAPQPAASPDSPACRPAATHRPCPLSPNCLTPSSAALVLPLPHGPGAAGQGPCVGSGARACARPAAAWPAGPARPAPPHSPPHTPALPWPTAPGPARSARPGRT